MDAQSVKDNMKVAKNNQNVSSEAKDAILTSKAPSRNAKYPGQWSHISNEGNNAYPLKTTSIEPLHTK